MIPAAHALRAVLALKLWSIERKSHVMALVADQGLALFAGLNVIPKKSFLSEYSHRIGHAQTLRLLAAWHEQARRASDLFAGESFNLDFHSIPYYGEHPVVERHYVSMRIRRQPSILAFLAQDADGRAFCYSNADLRKGEEAEEVFRFLDFWKRTHGALARATWSSTPSSPPTQGLARLDAMGSPLHHPAPPRSPTLLQEIAALPPSAWRTVELVHVTRKFRTPRVYRADRSHSPGATSASSSSRTSATRSRRSC